MWFNSINRAKPYQLLTYFFVVWLMFSVNQCNYLVVYLIGIYVCTACIPVHELSITIMKVQVLHGCRQSVL